MYRFQPPWKALKVLLNPQAFDLDVPAQSPSTSPIPQKFGKANGASFFFWSSIIIHLMPIGMMYFTGAMSLTFVSILTVNYLLMSYFVGACALGYAPAETVGAQTEPERQFDIRMLLIYSILFMLTGAWPLIYLKIAVPAGIIGMIVLPIYLLIGLSTILHFFYQAPTPEEARGYTMLQHVYGFIAERILPESISLHHMVKVRIEKAVFDVKTPTDPRSSNNLSNRDNSDNHIPVAREVRRVHESSPLNIRPD